jgi:hypothetical protein
LTAGPCRLSTTGKLTIRSSNGWSPFHPVLIICLPEIGVVLQETQVALATCMTVNQSLKSLLHGRSNCCPITGEDGLEFIMKFTKFPDELAVIIMTASVPNSLVIAHPRVDECAGWWTVHGNFCWVEINL